MKNCPNCAAPIGVNDMKCPYCGTHFFDFADIPIGEPFMLRLRLDDGNIFAGKVMVREAGITTLPGMTYRRPGSLMEYTIIGDTIINMEFEVV